MSQGTPLAGVEAVLTKWGNKAQVKRDTTDANGYFAVSDLEPGYYYFNVVGDTGEELIRIMPDMTMQVDVEKK
jgi:uncharacterized GH25 family protein